MSFEVGREPDRVWIIEGNSGELGCEGVVLSDTAVLLPGLQWADCRTHRRGINGQYHGNCCSVGNVLIEKEPRIGSKGLQFGIEVNETIDLNKLLCVKV